MPTSTYLTGVLFLALVFGGLLYVASRARRAFLLEFDGAIGALVDVVLTMGLFVVIAEVLGTANAFRPLPIIAVVVALVSAYLLRPPPQRRTDGAAPSSAVAPQRAQCIVAALIAASVFAQWSARTLDSLHRGIVEFDSLNYHLPFAARFVQDGAVRALNVTSPGGHTNFHPANSELVHAVGMMAFNRDIVSPLLNLFWLGVFLLACWCVGRRHGLQPVTMAAGALVASVPTIVSTNAGSAANDIVALSFLVASVAILGVSRRPLAFAVAGLAAGLAVGTKLSVLVAVIALTAAAIALAPTRSRLRHARIWLAAMAAGGAYWFARNLLATGSPLPSAHLGIGPLSFPRPSVPLVDSFGYSVAHYARSTDTIRSVFGPGLRDALGASWPVLLLVSAIGIACALFATRDSFTRAIGCIGAVAAAGYLVTPTTAIGKDGAPVRLFFAVNVRYLVPAILLSLFASALALVARHSRWAWPALLVLGTCCAAAQTTSGLIEAWPPTYRTRAIALAAAGLVIVAVAWLARGRRLPLFALGAVCAIALLGTELHASRTYLDERYRAEGGGVGDVYRWATTVRDARIAVVGQPAQYPLYGPDLSNTVRYLARRTPHGGFLRIDDPAQFTALVHDGAFDYVVASPYNLDDPFDGATWRSDETQWLLDDPRAHLLFQRDGTAVFAIDR
jgi:hypothetical protein